MNRTKSRSTVGLRLSRGALGVLRERGIFAQSAVSLEHQHLAKCYVIRGLESGGAAGDVGHYVTFAREDGRPAEYFCLVETIGVNGPHAVVLAPVLVRIEMLRKASTYELLISQHRPSSVSNGKRPLLEAKILFRGVHGRLELDLSGKDKSRASTVLPTFCSRGGDEVGIPRRFRSAVRAVTAAVNCAGCSHCHYTMVQQEEEKKLNALAESANSVKSAGDRLTRAIQEGRRLLREKLKNYALVCCLFVFLFVVLGGGLRLNPGGAFLGAATGTPLIICGFSRPCGRAHKQAGQSNDAPT